jgi:hypothetical protein
LSLYRVILLRVSYFFDILYQLIDNTQEVVFPD